MCVMPFSAPDVPFSCQLCLPILAKSQAPRARRTAWRIGASQVNRRWAKELRCAKPLAPMAHWRRAAWRMGAGSPWAAKRLAGWRAFPKSFAAHDIHPPASLPPTCPWRVNSGDDIPRFSAQRAGFRNRLLTASAGWLADQPPRAGVLRVLQPRHVGSVVGKSLDAHLPSERTHPPSWTPGLSAGQRGPSVPGAFWRTRPRPMSG
jgi:hypothetical protein